MARLPFDPERTRAARQRTDATPGGDASGGDRPLTVSQLADRIKTALADHFPQRVRVVGEVSNLSQRQHWFFSLKDEKQASLRCVCFASSARRITAPIEDGMEVVATGRLDFYPAQGQTQLYVDDMQPVGQGALELKLRQLIDQLREEGYFDEAHKRPLPVMPTRVAVVTSRSAAALQDVINTAHRRWPGCRLFLLDVRVQGASAAPEIAAAIHDLSKHGQRLGIDAIILTRGGGSIEDLWAFNERTVADAIYHCRLPVVAAVGHETDVTVAELVADLRCATPTQAAMKLIPERDALHQQLSHLAGRLRQDLHRQLHHARHRLDSAASRPFFRQPRVLTDQARRQVDQLEARLARALPHRLQPAHQRLDHIAHRLHTALPQQLRAQRDRLTHLARHLEAVSPTRVLERGFTYTLDSRGQLVRHAADATPGQTLTTVFADGRVRSRVEGDTAKRSTPKPTTPDQNTLF